jgi:DNA recombination protein RmuC
MQEFLHALSSALTTALPPEFSPALLALLLLCCCVFLLLTCCSLFLHQKRLARRLREAEGEKTAALLQVTDLRVREAQLSTLLGNERKSTTEKLQMLEHGREEMKLQFEHLASRIFDEKSAKFSQINREKLDAIITPFSEQLGNLKQEINEIYLNDTRERASLKSEILQLRDLNQQINREAINLTRALKSDSKSQGNWGELVLERVLEKSGLRKGHEYSVQGGYRDNSNRLLKPDVILHLPENKDIIIDSKVSLRSWEKCINSDNSEEKQNYLEQLCKALREHVKGLSAKNYPELRGLKSLDFVLMFLPIEAAFSSAVEEDTALLGFALSHNIIIVTPTTLLATLRTVENIWQFDFQSKNSTEIARRAGIMYDKFRGFIEDMEKIGKQLSSCQASYETALSKLTKGRGNLVSQAQQVKDLGIQVKKNLPKSITEISDLEIKIESGPPGPNDN